MQSSSGDDFLSHELLDALLREAEELSEEGGMSDDRLRGAGEFPGATDERVPAHEGMIDIYERPLRSPKWASWKMSSLLMEGMAAIPAF